MKSVTVSGNIIEGMDAAIECVQSGGERVLLKRDGEAVLGLVPLSDLAFLDAEDSEDRKWGEAARAALRRIESGEARLIAWEDVKAEIDRKRADYVWQPIALPELLEDVFDGLLQATDRSRALFKEAAIKPTKWRLSPWGNEGGGFWALAVHEGRVLWYNDIEHGFNVSRYVEEGVIPSEEYWCNQDGIWLALLRLCTGDPYPNCNLGPPQPIQ